MTDTDNPPAGALEWLAASELLVSIYLSGIQTGIQTALINCTDASMEDAAESRNALMASLVRDPIAFEQARRMLSDFVLHGTSVNGEFIKAYSATPPKG